MKSIYILGAGGQAKEVFALLLQIGGFRIEGFIDVEAGPSIRIGQHTVKIFPESHLDNLGSDQCLAMGVGSPKLIAKFAARYKNRFQFPNLIHPSAIGHFDDIQLGIGNIICASCIFTTSIKTGSFNLFNFCSTIAHDVVIGSCNVINPSVNVSGGVVIGDNNLIGVNATILQYRTIGSNSIIGASSLVTKDIPDAVQVIGIPAVTNKLLTNG